ncbi:MAG: MarR family winged helix-turn-helix transcriptional regulator [Comamonadaceae bacterium]|nr:MarR family winged helix-turn-helix transcriptional regulator [Comamonadaceae bacterium]
MTPYTLDQFGHRIDTFKHLFTRWIGQTGLNYNTYAVLYSLATAEGGLCTQKAIAHEWLIAKQTVSNVCKDFHAKGWVAFSESPHDKRERLMRLTAAGRAQAEPMMRLWDALDRRIFAAFGQEKAAEMFALLDAFARVFEAAIELPPPRTSRGNVS